MRTSPPFENTDSPALNTRSILTGQEDGRELSAGEALHLLTLSDERDLAHLREVANAVREGQVGKQVLYTTGCSLFITNLCEMAPTVYPYPAQSGDEHGYTLDIDAIDQLLERAVGRKTRQLYLSGGGFWPYLEIRGLRSPNLLQTCARLVGYIRDRYPSLKISGFSPDEIEFVTIIAERSARYVLEMLKDYGLSALGGNGVELLDDSLRQSVSHRKATVKRWLEIVMLARKLHLPVSAKMECHPLDTLSQRVTHLERLRQTLKKHPQAFSGLTPQLWLPPASGKQPMPVPPHYTQRDRLKLTAVNRLFLGDVLPNQQVFWQPGPVEQVQECLAWGANDLGTTDPMAYYDFLSGRRATESFSESEFQRLITEVGREPLPQA